MNFVRSIDQAARKRLAAGHRSFLCRSTIQTTTRVAGWAYRSPIAPYPRSPHAIIARTVERGSVVIDGGANIGQMTRMASVCVGPCGEVHAFEPNPKIFQSLENCITGAGFRNVRCNNLALSDSLGTLSFYLAPNGLSSSLSRQHLMAGGMQATEEIVVSLITLDAYAEAIHRPVDFIKLDLEGHELPALSGAQSVLERDYPVVLAEVSVLLDPSDMFIFMFSKGYTARSIGTGQEFMDPASYSRIRHDDVLFIHSRSRLRRRALRCSAF